MRFNFLLISAGVLLLGCNSTRVEDKTGLDSLTVSNNPAPNAPKSMNDTSHISILTDTSDSLVAWSPSNNGLRVGIKGEDNGVLLYLQNTSGSQLKVYSHVNAGEIHYDPFRLTVEGTSNKIIRELALFKDRNQSGPGFVILEPGTALRHSLNIPYWAAAHPGTKPLQPGSYRVRVKYAPTSWENEGIWIGSIEAGPVIVTVK
jgi:hypothetical protein